MQVVIEVSKEQYDALCMKGVMVLESQLPSFLKALRNGTPLPEGHGDLIDRSKIAFDHWSVDGHVCVWRQNIFNMPVIVTGMKMPKSCGECNASGTGVCRKWVSVKERRRAD